MGNNDISSNQTYDDATSVPTATLREKAFAPFLITPVSDNIA
jgi:hypothetical protein